jgi:hypothetical protein
MASGLGETTGEIPQQTRSAVNAGETVQAIVLLTNPDTAMILHGKNQGTKAAAVGCVLFPRFSAAIDSARRFR